MIYKHALSPEVGKGERLSEVDVAIQDAENFNRVDRDVIKAIEAWKDQGCLVVNMAPQPAGRVFNASGKTIHGIRVEMKR